MESESYDWQPTPLPEPHYGLMVALFAAGVTIGVIAGTIVGLIL